MKSPAKTPDGMNTVTPHLVCAGAAQAIEFYKQAFDATEMFRLDGKNGTLLHASLRLNGGSIMLADEMPDMKSFGPKTLKGTAVTIHLIVPDADKSVAQAVKAGAKVVMPVADMFWGDRYGIIEDPFGHRWSISTPKKTMTPAEIQKAARAAMSG